MSRWPMRDEAEYHTVLGMRERLPEGNGVPNTRYWDQRLLVLSKYGGECVCCGESHPKFLSIDHIGQTGAEHRANDPRARNITQWLIKNHFPEGFQVLCHNCNMATRDGDPCPHRPHDHKIAGRRSSKRLRVDKLQAGSKRPPEIVPAEIRHEDNKIEDRAQFVERLVARRFTDMGIDGDEVVRARQDECITVKKLVETLKEVQ